MNDDDRRLDQLLGRGQLGGPAYDAILEKVLKQVEPRRPAWWRWAPVPVVAVASLGIWLAVRVPMDDGFRSKGAGTPSGVVAIACSSRANATCRVGDNLAFVVNSALVSGYLGAYAERTGDATHERIWYFPTASGSAPFVAAGNGTVALPDGVRIGTEHDPGHYRVTVWLSTRPVVRSAVDRLDERELHARTTLDLEVVP